ncbi:hypothetical protein [Chlamydiifrater phoenicopteri]|uniref:hypothetical protein n=1 Tax=Chlamydiifrater phoenicopteri TaxID=2681469 RepID=UPI001BCB8A95|nr:hypothetical protein [Chlamydiifrater phoenicopteri]
MDEESPLHLLKKKKGFFSAILKLTEVESSLSLSDLEQSLRQKRILLSCIKRVDEKLEPFQSYLKEAPSIEIYKELTEIRLLIEKVLSLDETHYTQRRLSIDL